MFAVGSCYAASIRGKDEAKNQLFGGVGAGLVIGAKCVYLLSMKKI